MDADAFAPGSISDWFWRIVDEAGRDRGRLRALLESMPREDVIRFDRAFRDAAMALTEPPYSDHMGDLSEDGVQDVTEWVVSQGKAFYSEVWAHPERIPAQLDGPPSRIGSFSGVADNVFSDRFDEVIPLDE